MNDKIIMIILANEERGRTTQTPTRARTPRQTGGRGGGGEEERREGAEEWRDGGEGGIRGEQVKGSCRKAS